MSHQQWRNTLDSKVIGTWNLHHAASTVDTRLDFFLMISSVSGSFPSATQGNYCAANSFLDQFSMYRRRQNLPASAIGFGVIGEIGFVHENQELEDIFRRRGFKPLSEEDVLIAVDMALQEQINWSHSRKCKVRDRFQGHFIVGLGADYVKNIIKGGIDTAATEEPRLSIIRQAAMRLLASSTQSREDSKKRNSSNPLEMARQLSRQDSEHAAKILYEPIYEMLADKLSSLTLIARDIMKRETRFADIGIDSMFAAEFRGFLFQTIKLDVPFLVLMDESTSLGSLTEQGVAKVIETLA